MISDSTITKRDVTRRCFSALMAVLLLFCALAGRLAYLQLFNYEDMRNEAMNQYYKYFTLPASRGKICDRNGRVIAMSETVETVFISPYAIKEADDKNGNNNYRELIADGLSELLDVTRSDVLSAAEKTYSKYVVIKKNVDEDTATTVRQFIIDNSLYSMVNLEEDSKRYYEYSTLASHVIGFTGTDGGLTGLEFYYNDVLTGTDGYVESAKTGKGYDYSVKSSGIVDAQNGLNLVTTIDVNIQSIVEKYLEKVYYDQKVANRVAAVIMDVDTGEIYASAVYPSFDLNDPYTLTDEFLAEYESALGTASEDSDESGESNEVDMAALKTQLLNEMWNNKVVTELYEPGSTFKIVTTAIALEEGYATLNTEYNCQGIVEVDGVKIHCHKAGGHGTQSFAETLQNSCNPAFISLGLRIGTETFMKYFEEFGYLDYTGCDMVGENKTYYFGTNNTNFSRVDLATYSFGQSFKTSILQQLRAVSAVANGGYLVTPHVAKYLQDDNGNITYTYEYDTDRQVISEDVANSIVDILYGGINTGSTKNAAVEGYSIAAKTGTSQKLDITDRDAYVSSCVAFAPAEDPQIAIIVVVDEPTSGDYYGGIVAAPVVSSILSEVLPYLEIPRNGAAEHVNVNVVNYTGKSVDDAKKAISDVGLEYRIVGEGELVVDQMPKAGTSLTEGGTVILYTDNDTQHKTVTVPDIMNYYAQHALELLEYRGLNVKITGAYSSEISGTPMVVSQDIPAGTEVEEGTVITIEFRYYENING